MPTLQIRQDAEAGGYHNIRLTLRRSSRPDQEAVERIRFALSVQEQEDLRWYLEDYLDVADVVERVTVEQIESMMRTRGEELYSKVLDAKSTRALWFSIRNELANLRVEILSDVAGAASIPWELMRDPASGSPIALRAKSFVRVHANPNSSFVPLPRAQDGPIRLLYVACRPYAPEDVELRAIANRLLQDLGAARARFDIHALRPPTFERLQAALSDAKAAGRAYHIVHFDGHGEYADRSATAAGDLANGVNVDVLNARSSQKHGYLAFETTTEEGVRLVDGQTLGQLLHDTGVPVLVLNACQSAMHDATAARQGDSGVHDQIRAIGSLTQAVADQGIPAVLGMRYSVYVVTAAQFVGHLYAGLAMGRSFGEAVTDGRKHLQLNPERWIGLARPLQDWFVPVVYEAAPLKLASKKRFVRSSEDLELDPVLYSAVLRRYVPEDGFIGRDETILALDRAFDRDPVVLLHAYAGQGKTSTAVEFARWYSVTGGLGKIQSVLVTSFDVHADLNSLLTQIAEHFAGQLAVQGIAWSAQNAPIVRRQIVIDLLRQVPILWIWDNVERIAGFPNDMESQWSSTEQDELRDFLKQITVDPATRAKVLLMSRRDEQKWLGAIPSRVAMKRMRTWDCANLTIKLGKQRRLKASEIADWRPVLDYSFGNPLTLRVLVGQALRTGLSGREQIAEFVDAVRSGEQVIADEEEGRDHSLAASLDYGFRHAFQPDELPIIALLHLFRGTTGVGSLRQMGEGPDALPEMRDRVSESVSRLLNRAKDIGLLTPVELRHNFPTPPGIFTIHPAVPWFLRQEFDRLYNGENGRSSSDAAILAWVAAFALLSRYYAEGFHDGNRAIVLLIELEEANFLHARRLARRNQWWGHLSASMASLNVLYEHQGRTAEWASLVEEIRSDFCTDDDEPVPDTESEYGAVMSYRVYLAKRFEHDLIKAEMLQRKSLIWARRRAADLLAQPTDTPFDDEQRHRLKSLATNLTAMGQVLLDKQSMESVSLLQESVEMFRQIGDRQGEAIAEFGIGHAYLDLPTLRDLDRSQAAYERSLKLHDKIDALGRTRCIYQIGMLQYRRLVNAAQSGEPRDKLLRQSRVAEKHILQALSVCPPAAVIDHAPMYNLLGALYQAVGPLEKSRRSFERAANIFDAVGDWLQAGVARRNIALTYAMAAEAEPDKPRKRSYGVQALAYAEAALRDFQHYQGRAADQESVTRKVIEVIETLLNGLQ